MDDVVERAEAALARTTCGDWSDGGRDYVTSSESSGEAYYGGKKLIAESLFEEGDRAWVAGSKKLVEDLVSEIKRLRAPNVRAHVQEFHRVFGQAMLDTPTVPGDDVVRLRATIVSEEAFEFVKALIRSPSIDELMSTTQEVISKATVAVDLVEAADALADIDYVVEGSRLAFGIDGGPLATEVHRSNMSKLGADGKPVIREDGKRMKGPNYSPPDLATELRKQGWVG